MEAGVGRRLALIIASSDYEDETLRRLITPSHDAEALARALSDPRIGNFEVKTLVNRPSSDVRYEIEGFFRERKRDDLLLIHFSGHGIKDDAGRLFLATPDTRRDRLRATAIPATFIHDVMDDSRSRRQVLILDCCHSGAFPAGMRPRGGETAGIDEHFKGGRGRAVLTASNALQYAFEGGHVESVGQAQQSIFTRHLVRGLETGEADQDHDGWISLDELYDYVHDRVHDEMPQQTPMIWQFGVEGDIVIARNPHPRPVETSPVSQDEVSDSAARRRIQRLWTDALDAFFSRNWLAARDALRQIVDLQPDFRDAPDKLKEAERQCALMEAYEKGSAAQSASRWEEAIADFSRAVELDSAYRDAAARLAQAREQLALARLYEDARVLARDERWDSAFAALNEIYRRDPRYPDADGLRLKAAEELRKAKIEATYHEGLEALDHGEWKKALRVFVAVEREQRDYRQVRQHLATVRAKLSEATPRRGLHVPMAEKASQWLRLRSVRVIAALTVSAIAGWMLAGSVPVARLRTLQVAQVPLTSSLQAVATLTILVTVPGLVAALFKPSSRRLIVALLVSGLAFVVSMYMFEAAFPPGSVASGFRQARTALAGAVPGLIWSLVVALILRSEAGNQSLLWLPVGTVGLTLSMYVTLSALTIPSLGRVESATIWIFWGIVACGLWLWTNPATMDPAVALPGWTAIRRYASRLIARAEGTPVARAVRRHPRAEAVVIGLISATGCALGAAGMSAKEWSTLQSVLIYGPIQLTSPSLAIVVKWTLIVAVPGIFALVLKYKRRLLSMALIASSVAFALGVLAFYSIGTSNFISAWRFGEQVALVQQYRLLALSGTLGMIFGLVTTLACFARGRSRSLLWLPLGFIGIAGTTYLSLSPPVIPSIASLGSAGAIAAWGIWGLVAALQWLWVSSRRAHLPSTNHQ